MDLLKYEKDTLENLANCFRGLDLEEEGDNLKRFFGCVPEISINEHGAILELYANNKELLIGFGEYGGMGEIWNGQLCWETIDHDRADTSLDFIGNYVCNGSPLYVWQNITENLGKFLDDTE